MKITSVRTHLLTAQWVDDPWFPQLLHSTALVEIETDAKLSGFGEITFGYFAPECVPSLVEFFARVLVGRDPLDRARLARNLYDEAVWWARSGAGRSVISGIELALWDLQGKALNVPVYQLLGGKVRGRIRVYASGGATCWPKEENRRKVGFYAEQGYRATKLSTNFYELPPASTSQHQGRLTEVPLPFADQIEQLLSLFNSLRCDFGEAMDFAIDGHQGGVPNPIPVSEAIQIANALSEFRLRFYEEPLSYSDVEGYGGLRSRSPIPIAGGESLCGLDQFHAFLSAKGFDLVQPDLGFDGGLAETLRIIHEAEALGVATAIHTGASVGPAFAAAWHLAAASESVEWLEHVVAARSVQSDLLVEKLYAQDGYVGLPAGPGLGVRFDRALLRKYKFVQGSGERT
jgi:L-alanine-DL-glutamate epimerase-like enolase superfamily enzyme